MTKEQHEARTAEWERHLARVREDTRALDEGALADRIARVTTPLWGKGWGDLTIGRGGRAGPGDEPDCWLARVADRAGVGDTPRDALVELWADVSLCARRKADDLRAGLSGEAPIGARDGQ